MREIKDYSDYQYQLARRVVCPVLAEAGIEYTLLDEEHFRYAGVKDIHTSYITEDEGRPLRVFPIDKKLRYLIPFHLLEEVDAYLKGILEKGGVAILGDDGEKFGLWPGTHEWVYEEGWLRKFMEFVKAENINTMTFSEYIDSTPPGGKVIASKFWDLARSEASSLTGVHVRRGPSGVPTRFNSSGMVMDWLKGMPGVGVWNQPI